VSQQAKKPGSVKIRCITGNRRQLSALLHLPHLHLLGCHVGFDLRDHCLKLGIVVQRFQIRIVLEEIPRLRPLALVYACRRLDKAFCFSPGENPPDILDGAVSNLVEVYPASLSFCFPWSWRMKKKILAMLVLVAAAHAQAEPADREARLKSAYQLLDTYAAREVQSKGIPGMSIALTDRKGLLHVATYGYADTKLKTAVTPETKFEIGSIAKSFTVIALLQLQEQGKFDPQQPITNYLPWFSIQSKYRPITGHDVMTHTAGLPRDRDDIPSSLYQAAAVRDRWTGYEPGKHFAYSNIGYQILGYLLQEITGKPSSQNVSERVLKPLAMSHTEPLFNHGTYARLATGYSPLYDDRPYLRGTPVIEATWLEYAAGDGAIVSTATDMAKYLRMLLNRGAGPSGRIISDGSFQLLTQKGGKESDDGDAWYGYGISTWAEDGHHFLGHTGGMVGYSSVMAGDIDSGVGVSMLVNGPGGPIDVPAYALKLLRAAYEGKDLPPVPEEDIPVHVKNASEYAGTYRTLSGETLAVEAQGESLRLNNYHGRTITLHQHGKDEFLAADPEFNLFPLVFSRQNDKVVEAFYGDTWYLGQNYSGPREFKTPAEWASYPGHYRSNQAWLNNFRIVLRKGQLRLVLPDGEEWPMTPDGKGGFWAGDEGRPPQEEVSCDTPVHGETLRCLLSGQGYYRVFTP
jgi:D-alanyl-D-alanine carboxypeptidase